MRGFLAALLLLCGLAAPAMAHPPFGLVVDPTGNIYFSDLETVWRLSPDGQLSVFRAAVPETHVHELALAPDGAIEGDQNHYDPATERFYTGLWRRTPTGEEQQVVSLTERPTTSVESSSRKTIGTATRPSVLARIPVPSRCARIATPSDPAVFLSFRAIDVLLRAQT